MAADMPVPLDIEAPRRVVDYDSHGYDYRKFWKGRDYEAWAESRVLDRLLPQLGKPTWFADFGGGFGRNAPHYRDLATHSILVDYSVTNLTRAAEELADDVDSGRIHLIRSDLNALPLVDGAVDAAMVVRVLHHLSDVDRSLTEMARTVARRWLVDVPIKHHLLGRVRSALHGQHSQMRSADPLVTGSSDYPFRTFHLGAVRQRLGAVGFETRLAASVNNFRRWDQVLPGRAVDVLRPAVYWLEIGAQNAGRGWWGPSQFVLASRRQSRPLRLGAAPDNVAPAIAELARRLACPSCHGALDWTSDAARCAACDQSYLRRNGFWDFVVPG